MRAYRYGHYFNSGRTSGFRFKYARCAASLLRGLLAEILNDVQSRPRTVADVRKAAVIEIDVVGLDHGLEPRNGRRGRLRHVVADFLRMARIADIHRAYSGVESIRIHAVRSSLRNVDIDFKAAYAVRA